MRVVELSKFLEFRKSLDRRITLYYSSIVGIVFALLIFISGSISGIIWGIIMFLLAFGIIYGIRVMANNGAEKKRNKAVVTGDVLDVTLDGEFGLLTIEENKINYISLQKFGLNKIPEIEINEDLFISIGKYKYGTLQKLKLGADIRCQMTFKEMPNGIHRRFDFYDIDGSLEKMTEILDKVNKFNLEKHQA